MVLEGGKVLGGVSTQYPHPLGMECIKGIWGVSGATALHSGKIFIKQNLQGAPDLVGVGHLFGPQILTLGPRGAKRGSGGVLQPQQCILAKALQ